MAKKDKLQIVEAHFKEHGEYFTRTNMEEELRTWLPSWLDQLANELTEKTAVSNGKEKALNRAVSAINSVLKGDTKMSNAFAKNQALKKSKPKKTEKKPTAAPKKARSNAEFTPSAAWDKLEDTAKLKPGPRQPNAGGRPAQLVELCKGPTSIEALTAAATKKKIYPSETQCYSLVRWCYERGFLAK